MTYLMVAPNGARKTTSDHPALPVTIAQTVATAQACWQAGAQGLHAHVRRSDQTHLLDVGVYRELLAELAIQVPELEVQVTTEAVGVYQASEQRKLVEELNPAWVSLSVRELGREPQSEILGSFYAELKRRETRVQHILYGVEDLQQLCAWRKQGLWPEHSPLSVLWVLGRYARDGNSDPAELVHLETALQELGAEAPEQVMVCAFGQSQIPCLVAAAQQGWDCRVGFENGWWKQDGSLAADNADLLLDLRSQLMSCEEGQDLHKRLAIQSQRIC